MIELYPRYIERAATENLTEFTNLEARHNKYSVSRVNIYSFYKYKTILLINIKTFIGYQTTQQIDKLFDTFYCVNCTFNYNNI